MGTQHWRATRCTFFWVPLAHFSTNDLISFLKTKVPFIQWGLLFPITDSLHLPSGIPTNYMLSSYSVEESPFWRPSPPPLVLRITSSLEFKWSSLSPLYWIILISIHLNACRSSMSFKLMYGISRHGYTSILRTFFSSFVHQSHDFRHLGQRTWSHPWLFSGFHIQSIATFFQFHGPSQLLPWS